MVLKIVQESHRVPQECKKKEERKHAVEKNNEGQKKNIGANFFQSL